MRADHYLLENDRNATPTGREEASATELLLKARRGLQVPSRRTNVSRHANGQSTRMNAAEILANVVGVVAKAQDWSDEQKLQAASEILNVLKREGHLVLDPDAWEFVYSRAGGFLKGPFSMG